MHHWTLPLLLLTACPKTTPAPAVPEPPAAMEEEVPAAAPVLLEEARNLSLWRVEKDGAVNHFFGTCHLRLDLDEMLPEEHRPLLTRSRIFMNEARTDSINGIEALQMLWNTTQLHETIGEDTFRALAIRLGPSVPTSMLTHFPSWAAAPLMGNPPPTEESGATTLPILDIATENLARDSGVEIQSLETMQEQIEIISSLDHQFTESLQQSIGQTEPSASALALGPACLTGDGDKAYRLLSQENGEISRELLTARNQNWVKVLGEPLSEGGVFVAVGALHMFGPDGLLTVAESQGYQVTQLQTRIPLSPATRDAVERVIHGSAVQPAPPMDEASLAHWQDLLSEQLPTMICSNPVMDCFRPDTATCEADVRRDLRACMLPMAHQLPGPEADPSTVIGAVAQCSGSSPIFSGIIEETLTTGEGCEQAEAVFEALSQPAI